MMNKQKTQEEMDQESQAQPSQDPAPWARVGAGKAPVVGAEDAEQQRQGSSGFDQLAERLGQASSDRERVESGQPLLAKGEWAERHQAAEQTIGGIKSEIVTLAENSSVEEIQQFQDGIAGQRQQADNALRERQGLPKQATEQSMEQKIEQSNEDFQSATLLNPDRLKEWRQGRGQGGNQSQADDRQSDDRQTEKQGQGGPTNYAEYAAGSKEEAEDMKQLEQRQHKFVHDNGRWPRGGEIEKIEAAERAEREQEQTRKRTQ
jgi:hypothetical protein